MIPEMVPEEKLTPFEVILKNEFDWLKIRNTYEFAKKSNRLDTTDYDRPTSSQQSLFKEIFPSKQSEASISIEPTYESLRDSIQMTNSHALLIFEGL